MSTVKVGRIGKFDMNPRGNLWMDDENRFGYKLLSKMGWSRGKGLGKNETGITENLKVRMKMGNTGVGWDKKLPFAVDTHDLDAVLDSLNKKFRKSNEGEVKTDDSSISIEKRSHQFKNRLHYRKFVKGKDVSQYSDKDMNSIFISKALKSDAISVPEETTVTNVSNISDDVSTDDSIQTFKSKLSMTDYFAHKLKNKLGELSKPNIDSKEEPQCMETLSLTENQTTCRKRKKELKSSKKTKKPRLSEPEIIDKKNYSPEEVLDENIVEEYSSEICNNKIVKKAKLSHKKSKKFLKNKVQVLKSCLKNSLKNSAKFWLDNTPKKVSFCDNISYKRIENVLNERDMEIPLNEDTETYEELLSFNSNGDESETSEDEELLSFNSNGNESETSEEEELLNFNSNGNESETSEDEEETDETKSCSIINADSSYNELVEPVHLNSSSKCDQLKNLLTNLVERDVEEKPECLELPNFDGSNYNSWLKAQRTAMKMKMCNGVVKKIRRHPILNKTNLLEIKGYGNWGF